MADRQGTRVRNNFQRERIDSGGDTRSHRRDVGMAKQLVTTITFTASTARIAGANGEFAAFAVNDPIRAQGGLLNNGFFVVTGLDGVNQAYVTVDPPPKDEGPIAGITVRTV